MADDWSWTSDFLGFMDETSGDYDGGTHELDHDRDDDHHHDHDRHRGCVRVATSRNLAASRSAAMR